jgi:hypothetical protein
MGHLVLFKWNELSPFTESNQVLEIEARGQFLLHAVQTGGKYCIFSRCYNNVSLSVFASDICMWSDEPRNRRIFSGVHC